ncbi:GAF domain-containing protein [Persicobacter diffluens]
MENQKVRKTFQNHSSGQPLSVLVTANLMLAVLLLISGPLLYQIKPTFLFLLLVPLLLMVFISALLHYQLKSGFTILSNAFSNLWGSHENVITTRLASEFYRALEEILNISQYLEEKRNFAHDLAHSIFTPRDINPTDKLGQALKTMGEQLALRVEEDHRKNWVAEGLASFSNIFRGADQHDIQVFSDLVVSHMAKYIQANQVALYLEEEQEGRPILQMKACFAYDRKKFMHQVIEAGEGLVGQAYLEKLPIYLKEIPQDYYKITSGLGEALPANLYIIPLIFNDKIKGILEIASFHIFEDFELNFINQLGEDIAALIDSRQVQQTTQKLLEASIHQKQELEANEEELRQSMEEMQATREEMERLQIEEKEAQERMLEQLRLQNKMMEEVMDEVDGKIYIKDHQGRFYLFNKTVIDDYSVSRDYLKGKDDYHFFDYQTAKGYWEEELRIIASKKTFRKLEKVTVNQKEKYWLMVKRPIHLPEYNTYGLLGIQREVTDLLKSSPEYIEILKKKYPNLIVQLDMGELLETKEAEV